MTHIRRKQFHLVDLLVDEITIEARRNEALRQRLEHVRDRARDEEVAFVGAAVAVGRRGAVVRLFGVVVQAAEELFEAEDVDGAVGGGADEFVPAGLEAGRDQPGDFVVAFGEGAEEEAGDAEEPAAGGDEEEGDGGSVHLSDCWAFK